MTKYLQKLGDSGDDDILGNFNGGWRNYTPNPEGGNGGEGEAQVVGKEKDCIMLEDEDSEEEVQFLGHGKNLSLPSLPPPPFSCN